MEMQGTTRFLGKAGNLGSEEYSKASKISRAESSGVQYDSYMGLITLRVLGPRLLAPFNSTISNIKIPLENELTESRNKRPARLLGLANGLCLLPKSDAK